MRIRMVNWTTHLFLENTQYSRQKTVFSVEKYVSGLAIAIKNRCSPNGPKLSGNMRMRMVNGKTILFLRNTQYYGQKSGLTAKKEADRQLPLKIDVL
jgi:hypothetical protein